MVKLTSGEKSACSPQQEKMIKSDNVRSNEGIPEKIL